MERNRFNSPEFPSSSETSDDSDSESKKKKTKSSAAVSTGKAAERPARTERPAGPEPDKQDKQKEVAESFRSLWERTVVEPETDKSPKIDTAEADKKVPAETDEPAAVERTAVEATDETDTTAEADETLSPEEEREEDQLMAQEYIAARQQALDAELAAGKADEEVSPDDPDAVSPLADAAFLAALRDRLEQNPDENVAEASDAAYAATAHELDPEADASPEDNEDESAEAVTPDVPESSQSSDEAAEPDPNAATVPPSPSSTTMPPPPTPSGTSGNSSGGNRQPPPVNPGNPTNPGNPYYGPYHAPWYQPGVAANTSPVAAAVPVAANAARRTAEYQQPHTGTALLAGGIIGYLIGRRRGRIKTEKQLLPIQHKLEKRVREIEQTIQAKEARIRKLARERPVVPAAVERLKTVAHSERPPLRPGAATSERFPKPGAAPERPTLSPKPSESLHRERLERPVPLARPRTELLGSVTLKAAEAPMTRAEQAADVLRKIPASSMSRTELLAASGDIVVGATNLRRVYETNLISERGLRRIVAEHQHGGEVRKVLSEELLTKELSYERDPHLRDRPLNSPETASAAKANSATDAAASGLLPAVTATNQAHDAADDSSSGDEKSARVTGTPKPPHRIAVKPALVAANVVALVVLAILVVVLLLTRGIF